MTTRETGALMDHPAVRDQLTEYLDSTLGQGDRARLERHLVSCASCGAFTRTLGRTVALAQHLPRLAMPTAARERLRQLVIGQAGDGVQAGEDAVGAGRRDAARSQ